MTTGHKRQPEIRKPIARLTLIGSSTRYPARVRSGCLVWIAAISAFAMTDHTASASSTQAPLSRVSCLDLVERDPVAAISQSEAWLRGSGGDDARFCYASALFRRGAFRAAAESFEQVATNLSRKDPIIGANVLARAGLAWARAGNPDEAERAYATAIAVNRNDPELLIDRAIIRAGRERYWDAIADLDRAETLDPGNTQILALRARTWSGLGLHRPALLDANRLVSLDTASTSALALRAELRAAAGDLTGAQADLNQIIAAAPLSPAAHSAATMLRKLSP